MLSSKGRDNAMPSILANLTMRFYVPSYRKVRAVEDAPAAQAPLQSTSFYLLFTFAQWFSDPQLTDEQRNHVNRSFLGNQSENEYPRFSDLLTTVSQFKTHAKEE
ncbi:hypothetical protein BTVI_38968 [Pitangus sulphuratus]|nr:hypothetical protein BTVI_38968 [Pitangus sulphuratus]